VSSRVLPPYAFILFQRTGRLAGQSTARPFFRRAASTLAPPTLAIRVRKPDTRARLRRVPSSVLPFPFFRLHSMVRLRKCCETRPTGAASSSAAPASARSRQKESGGVYAAARSGGGAGNEPNQPAPQP